MEKLFIFALVLLVVLALGVVLQLASAYTAIFHILDAVRIASEGGTP